MSLESNPAQKLAEWVKETKQPKVEVKPEEPVAQKVNEPAKVEQPKEEKEETPKIDKTEEQKLPPSAEIAEAPQVTWDEEQPKEVATAPKFDFSKIGSALELGEINDENDFITKVSEFKTKIKTLEEAPLNGIPDEFKEVLQVARNGGEWKDYLAQDIIDYSKVDPIQLYEDEFFRGAEKNPAYFTEGKYDDAKAVEALEALPLVFREQMGKQIAANFMQSQHQRKAQLKAASEQKRVDSEQRLVAASKQLNDLLPLESHGIKFEPKHSSEIYEGISNSTLTKKYLGVDYDSLVRSGADMKQIAATVAMRHYGEKMIKFKSENSKVEAKKEILDKTQNAQLKTTGTAPEPQEENKKPLTAAEKLAIHFKGNRSGLM